MLKMFVIIQTDFRLDSVYLIIRDPDALTFKVITVSDYAIPLNGVRELHCRIKHKLLLFCVCIFIFAIMYPPQHS